MTFNQFKEIVDLMVEKHKRIHTLYKLNIDLIEALPESDKIIDKLWKHILTPEGLDWLDWFLYDKGYIQGNVKNDFRAFDEKKNEICKDLNDLYNYLKDQKYL